MKYLKKLASVALALVMVLALAAPAFAAPVDTLLVPTGETGHTYKGYQILVGDVAQDGSSLVDDTIVWGEKIDAGAIVAALQAATFKDKDGTTTYAGADLFKDIPSDATNGYYTAEAAQKVAKVLYENFEKTGGLELGSIADNMSALTSAFQAGVYSDTPEKTLDGKNVYMKSGYVLLKETVDGSDLAPVYHLVMTTGTRKDITTKMGKSGVGKSIQTVEGAWVNGAVWTEGQDIPFRLVVTLPDDLKNTDHWYDDNPYNVVLHDVMDPGLVNPQITAVKLFGASVKDEDLVSTGGTTVTHEFVTEDLCTNDGEDVEKIEGCDFEVKVNDLHTNQNAVAGGKLVVFYTAEFDPDEVVTGSVGNDNKVYLEVNGTPIGNDSAKAYEIELDVDKVGADGTTPLTGAQFALFKEEDLNEKGEPKEGVNPVRTLTPNEKDIYVNAAGTQYVVGDKIKVDDEEVTITESNLEELELTLRYPAGTHFTLKSLANGKYVLRETVVPNVGGVQYNRAENIPFEVNAHVIAPNNLRVDLTVASDSMSESGGNITATIMNVAGTQLPETGGIGTTIFYIVGGVLVVGAVVLLIAKRRTSVDDE